jgi:signal transduction histidine kinase
MAIYPSRWKVTQTAGFSVTQRLTDLAKIIALATLYTVAARIGLRVNAVSGFATLVWAPTGISLAALLILGGRFWPGVMIGAVAANLLTGAPPLVALGIGCGNTAEAVAGAWMLRHIPGFRTSLDRLPDVLGLILLAAAVSTTFSAAIGVLSLDLGGIISAARAGETWRAWWVGDLIGDLLFAPVLLAWATSPPWVRRPRRALEGAALGACLLAVSLYIFHRAPSENSTVGEAYMCFPVLVWAVLRFGQRGGTAATVVISLLAVWGTVFGYGPFVHSDLYQSLLALQIFLGVTAATFLVLGAAVSERRRAIGDLELAIVAQTRLHETAAEANRVKLEFMAMMSHELRTPLNAIAGYVELLQMGIRGPLTRDQEHDLERIRISEHALRRLIEPVLSFAKLEAGAIQYRFAEVALDAVLNDLESLVSPLARVKGLTYRCTLPGTDATAWTDREKLAQILVNLVSNAIKFTSEGHVEVHCEADMREARIIVADTGPGIPPELQESIFQPFVRGERALTRTAEGTGLGLAISRQLARAMGCDIAVASQVGVGSIFTVVLPRTRDAGLLGERPTPAADTPTRARDRYAVSTSGERDAT